MFVVHLVRMILWHQLHRRQCPRRPEPEALTDQPDNVFQYDRVMKTKLAAAYAGGLAVLSRALGDRPVKQAIDLACGPGHFTLSVARYLQVDQIVGIDFAPNMVQAARSNAERQGVARSVSFQQGDAMDLSGWSDDSVDLACCTDALHHMRSRTAVHRVLREMERVTRPSGLIMAMDLVRLRSEALTDYYVNVLGSDYRRRGLDAFFEDFRNSMFAAWTAGEMYGSLVKETGRWWCQLVPRGLPTVQIVLGLPVGRRAPFIGPAFGGGNNPLVRDWYPVWCSDKKLKTDWARRTRSDCRIVELGLATAKRRYLPPSGGPRLWLR